VLREFHAAGLTSVGDAWAHPGAIELYQEAERRGELSMRVGMLVTYPYFDSLRTLRIQPGFGSDFLRINGVKAFVDGAVGGRTCLLEEPFEGSDDHGQQVISAEALDELALMAQTSGMRLAVHANGDRALGLLLDSMEKAARAVPRSGLRHRIEHCTLVTPDILERMQRLDLIAVPFGSYVATHGDKLLDWYGEDRLERMFPHRSLLDAGITVAGSSDYTCAPFEPLLGIQSCVTRQTLNGLSLGRSQRITSYEALWIYTVGSAIATGEATEKGRIAPGYLADFTVLGADPLEVAPSEIASIPVLDTWVGGRTVIGEA
jgi:predicted amidohydrolase YtcJ